MLWCFTTIVHMKMWWYSAGVFVCCVYVNLSHKIEIALFWRILTAFLLSFSIISVIAMFYLHSKARITLLNVSKHEISVARQRYRLGMTHFSTLKSFTRWHFDKKTKFRRTTILFRVAHHFREIASKSHTIFKKYYSVGHRSGHRHRDSPHIHSKAGPTISVSAWCWNTKCIRRLQ